MNPYLIAYLKEWSDSNRDRWTTIDWYHTFCSIALLCKTASAFQASITQRWQNITYKDAFPHNFEDRRVPIYCILYGLCSFWLVDCSRKYCRWIWNTFSFLYNVHVKNNTNKIFLYLWSRENLHSTDNKIDRIFANASISKKVWGLKK